MMFSSSTIVLGNMARGGRGRGVNEGVRVC